MAWAEQLKSGNWRGGYRDANGRRRYSSADTERNIWPTKRLALAWATGQEVDVRRGRWQDPEAARLTFADWVERWWGNYAPTLEDSGRETARARVNKYLIEEWGTFQLGQISHTAVKAWTTRLRRDGRKEWTVTAIVGLFSGCMQAAVDEDLLLKNPAKGVKLERPKRASVEVDYTEDQLALITAEMEPAWALLTDTLAWTGGRWGEIAGLHTSRVDLMRGLVTFENVLVERTGLLYVKQWPKDEEIRVVPLPEHLKLRLAEHIGSRPRRDTCGFEHQRRGKPARCPGGVLVFGHWQRRWGLEPEGYIPRFHYRTYVWRRAIEKANGKIAAANADRRVKEPLIPVGRPHDLRHFYATFLMARGVPSYYVRLLTGHGDEDTLKRYLPGAGVQSHHARALEALNDAKAAFRDQGTKRGTESGP